MICGRAVTSYRELEARLYSGTEDNSKGDGVAVLAAVEILKVGVHHSSGRGG